MPSFLDTTVMTERGIPEQHRARSRDRSDQRRPTFQVLNVIQPKTHSHGKRERDVGHYGGVTNIMDTERDIKGVNGPYSLNNPPSPPKSLGVHTIGKKSCESIAGRSPACNFPGQLGGHSNSNTKNKSYSVVPGRTERPRSASPTDRVVCDDEASDLVVWDASKKTSRSNLLCPLTESECRTLSLLEKVRKGHPRARSNSVPEEHSVKKYVTAGTPSHLGLSTHRESDVLFKVDTLCKGAVELLDDFAPPSMSPEHVSVSPSPSGSTTTTYSLEISVVTQKLEEIRQAQDDVLRHLGEEMTKVTGENERLRKEVEHVRSQNEGLLKVVHDTSDELERMKQIFRTRNLSHPSSETSKPPKQDLREEPEVSPEFISHQQHHHQPNKQYHKGNRDSIGSNSSHKSQTHKKLSLGDGDPSGEEEPAFLRTSVDITSKSSSPKNKRTDKNKPLINPHNNPEIHVGNHMDRPRVIDVDESESYISGDSTLKSAGRKQADHHHHHHHHHSRHHTNSPEPTHHRSRHHTNSPEPTHQRSRSRSKSKSPRNSNYYEQDDKRMRHHHHPEKASYPRDDDNDIDMRPSGGGCLRMFSCCWSTSNARARTDSVDDVVLRQGCPG